MELSRITIYPVKSLDGVEVKSARITEGGILENDRTYATTVRDLRRLDIARKGRKVTFTYEADGFLYKMVRSLTGALVNVGLGKLTLTEVSELLKTRKRIPAVLTAPPQGLFLVKVIY